MTDEIRDELEAIRDELIELPAPTERADELLQEARELIARVIDR